MQEILQKAETLHEARHDIRRCHGRTFAVEDRGHAMIDAALRSPFPRAVMRMKDVGIDPVVVHGGGRDADERPEEQD